MWLEWLLELKGRLLTVIVAVNHWRSCVGGKCEANSVSKIQLFEITVY